MLIDPVRFSGLMNFCGSAHLLNAPGFQDFDPKNGLVSSRANQERGKKTSSRAAHGWKDDGLINLSTLPLTLSCV